MEEGSAGVWESKGLENKNPSASARRCLIQNVSQLVSHKHLACVSRVWCLNTPVAGDCWHSHDPHSSLNKPHAKQNDCLEFLGGNAAALGFSENNFC